MADEDDGAIHEDDGAIREGGSARPHATLGRFLKPLLAVVLLGAVSGAACGSQDSESGGTANAAPAEGSRTESADSALSALAAELLPAVVEGSGLEVRESLRLARRSRAELEEYLMTELREQLPPERAAGLGAAYGRLGLLPDTLDLVPFLQRLYLEQVAGYYDPARDTLYVMEGTEEDQLRSILVHEMVHALQDQHVSLDSLYEAVQGDNDWSQAVQAAVEGHATFVMAEWTLRRMMGRSVDLTTLPDIVDQISARTFSAAGGDAMPVLTSSPRIIRETLTFPYVDGLRFVQWLWKSRPTRVSPFGDELPRSTEQVLHPETLAGDVEDPPTMVRFPEERPGGWLELHSDDLGELETRIFLHEHLDDRERARRLATGWDGDRYVAARPAGDGEGGSDAGSGADGGPGADRDADVLAWVSVWDSPAAADSFSAGVREALGRRYAGDAARFVEVERAELEGRPVVRILDLPAQEDPGPWRRLVRGARLEPVANGGGP